MIQLTLTLGMTITQVVETSVTVLFRTTFTQTIKLNLLLKWLLSSNLSQYNLNIVTIILVYSSSIFESVDEILWWNHFSNFFLSQYLTNEEAMVKAKELRECYSNGGSSGIFLSATW